MAIPLVATLDGQIFGRSTSLPLRRMPIDYMKRVDSRTVFLSTKLDLLAQTKVNLQVYDDVLFRQEQFHHGQLVEPMLAKRNCQSDYGDFHLAWLNDPMTEGHTSICMAWRHAVMLDVCLELMIGCESNDDQLVLSYLIFSFSGANAIMSARSSWFRHVDDTTAKASVSIPIPPMFDTNRQDLIQARVTSAEILGEYIFVLTVDVIKADS